MKEIYTDGSTISNGKPDSYGGYGFVVIENDEEIFSFSSERSQPTTNNREEMKAIIHVLKDYGLEFPAVNVYTDSSYALNTFTKWMYSWMKNGWVKQDGTTPENLDLIQEYYNFEKMGYKINLIKVAGHQGNKWNERADQLAYGE